MDQVRAAILNSEFGARIADSSNFLQQILRISDRTDASSSSRASVAADPTAGEAAAAGASPGPANAAGAGDGRLYTLQMGADPFVGTVIPQLIVYDPPPERDPTEGFCGGWVERRLLIETYVDWPMLAVDDSSLGEFDRLAGTLGLDPRLDTLVLSGDFSAGFILSSNPAEVGQIVLRAGHDYVLAADDDFVAAGRTLVVDGQAPGVGNVMFDGSAETDGRFAFRGSDSDDYFFGGAGADSIRGLGGADVLSGGGGGDTFVYADAGDSSGAGYDLLADFDPAVDRIDLPGSVTGFAAAVTGGSLSEASFDDDLGAALGGLGARQAVWFAPDAGDLAGQIFLVVDGNGVAGYQEGEDFVFGIAGSPLADLTGHTGFFI